MGFKTVSQERIFCSYDINNTKSEVLFLSCSVYLSGDSTVESESTCAEQMPEHSGLSVMPETLPSTEENKLPIHASDVPDYSRGRASGSGFDFLGSLPKSQTSKQILDDSSDKSKNEVQRLDLESSLGKVYQDVSDEKFSSSTRTEGMVDRPVEKEMSTDSVSTDNQTTGGPLHVSPISCSPGHGDKPASSLLSAPKLQGVKQNIPITTKKKKKKGIRPGHEQSDFSLNEPLEQRDFKISADADSFSQSSQGSSSDVTNTATSFSSKGVHSSLGGQTIDESSSDNYGSRSKSVDLAVSAGTYTAIGDGTVAAQVSDVEEGETRADKSSRSENTSADEVCKRSFVQLGADHVSVATAKNSSDTVCQPSSSNSKMPVSLPQSAKELDSSQLLSAQKLLDDREGSSSNANLAVANYQVDLSAADKLTVLLEVIESKRDQLRLGKFVHVCSHVVKHKFLCM